MNWNKRAPSLLLTPLLVITLMLPVGAGVATSHLWYVVGKATSEADEPIASGDLHIRIFDAASGGTEVYQSGTDFDGAIQDGKFGVCVGGLTSLQLDNTMLYYLEVSVDGDEVLGDANIGRYQFYPGSGKHDLTDLEGRLDNLETLMGGGKKTEPATRVTAEPAAQSTEDYQVNFGVLGMGVPAGASAEYAVESSLLFQPVGIYTSPGHKLYLGPFYMMNESCCVGRVGDANGSGADEPTIGDLSVMIDALFIGNDWSVIACLPEADINQSGGTEPTTSDITIGDVSYLIDYMFITGSGLGLPNCL